ncbi:MAG: hypothetical protein AAB695_00815, partial [Patescibacteria group bacterium]
MSLAILSEGKELISASRAAKKVGYTSDYIGQLCRAKKIQGKLVGKTWYVDFQALVEYKKNRQYGKGRKTPTSPTLPLNKTELAKGPKIFPVLTSLFDKIPPAPKPSHYTFHKITAIALSIILAFGASFSLLREISPLAAGNSQVAAASLFDLVADSLSFLTDGWNELKQIALGGFNAPTSQENFHGLTRQNPTGSDTDDNFPDSSPPQSIAVTETTPSLTLDSIRAELKTELESYVNARLSGIESPIVVYSSSPVIREVETIRQEILLADTRPTVTRQSTSD